MNDEQFTIKFEIMEDMTRFHRFHDILETIHIDNKKYPCHYDFVLKLRNICRSMVELNNKLTVKCCDNLAPGTHNICNQIKIVDNDMDEIMTLLNIRLLSCLNDEVLDDDVSIKNNEIAHVRLESCIDYLTSLYNKCDEIMNQLITITK